MMIETTALGAAYLAGLAVGFWEDEAAISAIWKVDQTFQPMRDEASTLKGIEGWQKAIQMTNL